MSGRIQMQGRSTATQALVTWRVNTPDWAGILAPVAVTDVTLYLLAAKSVVAIVLVIPISCAIASPSVGATVTEASLVVITFTLNRPGTAVVKLGTTVLGAGVVSGLAGYFLWTPTTADVGTRTINVTATDATNGTTADATGAVITVAAAATYPTGLTTLLRFDPSQPAYQDLAQTTPALAPLGRVRSLPQPSPLSGSWTAPSDVERPSRDYAGTIACDPIAPDYPTHSGQFFNAPAPASAIAVNNATIAFSFRPFGTYNSPVNGLLAYGSSWGLETNGNGIAVRYNSGAQWYAGLLIGKDLGVNRDGDMGNGNLICIVVRFRPTGIDIYVDEEGTVYNPTPLVTTVSPGAPGYVQVGLAGGAGSGLYGQAAVIDGSVSDAKRDELIAFMKARGAAQAFPTWQPLVCVAADSIGAGFGTSTPLQWSRRMLANLRPTYPGVQLLNVSIGGSGVPPMTGTDSTAFKTMTNHISTARARNVCVLGFGTNDIVGNPLDSQVDARLVMLFALSDALRAQGAKVAIETVLPRSGLMGTTSQIDFNHGRARWNAALDANVGVRFDRLIDHRGVSGMGTDGDSNNATYFYDAVHPTDAGHALMEPAFTAAVAALLA